MRKLLMKEKLRLMLEDIAIKVIGKCYFSILKLQDSSREDTFYLEFTQDELEREYEKYYREDNSIIS